MNKCIVALLFLGYLNYSFAQDDSISAKNRNYEIGARSGLYFTNYSGGFSYFGAITLTIGKHEFSVGPSFGKSPRFSPFHNYDYYERHKFNGIDLSYRILPNGKGKVFDFYFQLNYLQKWGQGMANKTIYNYPNLYENTSDKVRLKSTASLLLLEYGFDIKFLKYCYVGTSIGIGGMIDFRDFQYETYSQFSYKETQEEIAVIYRASFGFRF